MLACVSLRRSGLGMDGRIDRYNVVLRAEFSARYDDWRLHFVPVGFLLWTRM
jgi:hypothetical protein